MIEATTEGAGDVPAPVWPEDERDCSRCGKSRPHTIRRINRVGAPMLCDPCNEEAKR